MQLAAGNPASRNLAIVRLRKGTALYQLRRHSEAETAILMAMDKLPTTDASLKEDRRKGFVALGDIAEKKYDYPLALSHYRSAYAITDNSAAKAITLRYIVRTGIFVDPAAALIDADTAIALISAEPKVNAEWLGSASDLRGRVLLNLGRTKEARTEFTKAIKSLGGLAYGKVNLLDTATRSNAAIAALRDNDPEEARRYLSYAGSAMQSDQGFSIGKNMNPPPCGGINGPKPEDVAVVEFSIREDGSVEQAWPIFYSGKPEVAVEFARAVADWAWSAEELKKVQTFFRAQTRLEMRCTNVFNKPSVQGMLTQPFVDWLSSKGLQPYASNQTSDSALLPLLRAELAKREARDGTMGLSLLPILYQLRSNSILPKNEFDDYGVQALAIGKAAKAPASARAYLEFAATQESLSSYKGSIAGKFQKQITRIMGEPDIAADPLAHGVLSIILFDSLNNNDRRTHGRRLLDVLANDVRALPNDPVKVGALIRLANLEYDSGRIDDARSLFAQSGLQAQQCALVDAKPRKTAGGISDSDYPEAALKWGFGGWTVVEFDIAADGKTLNERPLISFPPFVFGAPTVEQVKGFRYEQSFRPGGGLGCGGQQQRVTYRKGY
ncbi:MAG: hypothetical protein ABL918_12445 [Chakrabartia sp.]